MSQENVEVVERVIAAFNERDIDGYLACCADDIQLRAAWAAIGGVYDGPDAIRHFFADLRDTAPDFRLAIERLEPIGADRVLAFGRVTVSGRASGIAATDTPTDGKITRIRVFLDRQEALEAVGLRE